MTRRIFEQRDGNTHLLCLLLGALVLASSSSCLEDVSENPGATPRFCGNDKVDLGEQCDGLDLAGATCQSFGYYLGTLLCGDDCLFEKSLCHGICGDGIANGPESCDGEDVRGLTCENLNHLGGELRCKSDCTFDTSLCTGICGDGLINGSEECDGEELAGMNCQDFGFSGGELVCTEDCTLDKSGCISCQGHLCDGTCVDISNSVVHCGQCGTKCFPGQECVDGSCAGTSALSPQELDKALQNKDFLLINVRVPPWGMISGTDANVSDEQPDLLAETIGPDLHSRVVVYCRTNPRSLNAIQHLSERGYVSVCYLLGGVEAWLEAGYELESF